MYTSVIGKRICLLGNVILMYCVTVAGLQSSTYIFVNALRESYY